MHSGSSRSSIHESRKNPLHSKHNTVGSGGSDYKLNPDPEWGTSSKHRAYEPAKFGYTNVRMGFDVDGTPVPGFESAAGTEESRKMNGLESRRGQAATGDTPNDGKLLSGETSNPNGRTANNSSFNNGVLTGTRLSETRKPHSLLGAYINKRKDSFSRRQSSSDQDQEPETAGEPTDLSGLNDAKGFHMTANTHDTNIKNSGLSAGPADKNRGSLDPGLPEEKDFANLNHLGKMPKTKNSPPTHINAGISSVVGNITIVDSTPNPSKQEQNPAKTGLSVSQQSQEARNGPNLQAPKSDQQRAANGEQANADKSLAAKKEGSGPDQKLLQSAEGLNKPGPSRLPQEDSRLQGKPDADGLADSANINSSVKPSGGADGAEEKAGSSGPLPSEGKEAMANNQQSKNLSKNGKPGLEGQASKDPAKDLFGRTRSLAGTSKDKQAVASSSRKSGNQNSKTDFINDKLAAEFGKNPFSGDNSTKKPVASTDRFSGVLNFGSASKILKEPSSATKFTLGGVQKTRVKENLNMDRKPPSIKMANHNATSTAQITPLEQKLQGITRSDSKNRNSDIHALGNAKTSLTGTGNKTFVEKKNSGKPADGVGSTFVRTRGASLENARMNTTASASKELASSKLVDRRLQTQEERGRSVGNTGGGLRDSQELKYSQQHLLVGEA